jgi:hypothetical protein
MTTHTRCPPAGGGLVPDAPHNAPPKGRDVGSGSRPGASRGRA